MRVYTDAEAERLVASILTKLPATVHSGTHLEFSLMDVYNKEHTSMTYAVAQGINVLGRKGIAAVHPECNRRIIVVRNFRALI